MNSIKSLIYTVIGIVIFIAVARFFIILLPFLIITGLVVYIVSKVIKAINNRGNDSQSNTYKSYENNEDRRAYTDEIDDNYTGEVVDVDFEEVDK